MTLRVCLPTNNPQLEELSLSLTYHPSDGGGLLSFWIGRQGLSIKHMYCTLNVLQPCLFSQLFNVRVEKGNSAWGRFRKYWNQQPTIGWSVGFLYSHQLFVVDEEKMYFSVPTQIISKGEQPGTALFFSGLSLSLQQLRHGHTRRKDLMVYGPCDVGRWCHVVKQSWLEERQGRRSQRNHLVEIYVSPNS